MQETNLPDKQSEIRKKFAETPVLVSQILSPLGPNSSNSLDLKSPIKQQQQKNEQNQQQQQKQEKIQEYKPQMYKKPSYSTSNRSPQQNYIRMPEQNQNTSHFSIRQSSTQNQFINNSINNNNYNQNNNGNNSSERIPSPKNRNIIRRQIIVQEPQSQTNFNRPPYLQPQQQLRQSNFQQVHTPVYTEIRTYRSTSTINTNSQNLQNGQNTYYNNQQQPFQTNQNNQQYQKNPQNMPSIQFNSSHTFNNNNNNYNNNNYNNNNYNNNNYNNNNERISSHSQLAQSINLSNQNNQPTSLKQSTQIYRPRTISTSSLRQSQMPVNSWEDPKEIAQKQDFASLQYFKYQRNSQAPLAPANLRHSQMMSSNGSSVKMNSSSSLRQSQNLQKSTNGLKKSVIIPDEIIKKQVPFHYDQKKRIEVYMLQCDVDELTAFFQNFKEVEANFKNLKNEMNVYETSFYLHYLKFFYLPQTHKQLEPGTQYSSQDPFYLSINGVDQSIISLEIELIGNTQIPLLIIEYLQKDENFDPSLNQSSQLEKKYLIIMAQYQQQLTEWLYLLSCLANIGFSKQSLDNLERADIFARRQYNYSINQKPFQTSVKMLRDLCEHIYKQDQMQKNY